MQEEFFRIHTINGKAAERGNDDDNFLGDRNTNNLFRSKRNVRIILSLSICNNSDLLHVF